MKSWLTNTPTNPNSPMQDLDKISKIGLFCICAVTCLKLGIFLYDDAKKLLHITSEYLEITLTIMSIMSFIIGFICAFKTIRLIIRRDKDNAVFYVNTKDAKKEK